MVKRSHAGNTWTRRWGHGMLTGGGEQDAEGAGEGQEDERCGCPVRDKKDRTLWDGGWAKAEGAGCWGGCRELGKPQREELGPQSPVPKWRWGRKSPWDPWTHNCALPSLSGRRAWFTLYIVCPFHQRPQGTPNSARVWGCMLGEVPAASPDHQWLGVRTDIPLEWASINQEPNIGFSLSHTRWAQG